MRLRLNLCAYSQALLASPVVEPLMDGRIASVDPASNSFTITLAGIQGEPGAARDGQTLSPKTNSGTLYQGFSGLSMVSVGTYVNVDAAIQSNGSLLFGFERQSQGYLTDTGQAAVGMYFNFSKAAVKSTTESLCSQSATPQVPSRYSRASSG